MRNDGYWHGLTGQSILNVDNDPFYEAEYCRGQRDWGFFEEEKEQEREFILKSMMEIEKQKRLKLLEEYRRQREQEISHNIIDWEMINKW